MCNHIYPRRYLSLLNYSDNNPKHFLRRYLDPQPCKQHEDTEALNKNVSLVVKSLILTHNQMCYPISKHPFFNHIVSLLCPLCISHLYPIY